MTGLTGLIVSRPKVSPVIRLFSFLQPKKGINVLVQHENKTFSTNIDSSNNVDHRAIELQPPLDTKEPAAVKTIPLIKLAYARSGDKGNHSNIGVIARHPSFLPAIAAALTESNVTDYMQHVLDREHSTVTRSFLPGKHARNFLLENALGGGGIASLRSDPQGKAFAQQLLEFPIPISQIIVDQLTIGN